MQDRAITAIGRATGTVSDRKFENYVQNMFPGGEQFMLLLDFEQVDGQLCYRGVKDTPVDEVTYRDYGYRKGSPRGGDITPTTKAGDLTKKFKTFRKQIASAVETATEQNFQSDIETFRALHQTVERHGEQMVADLIAALDKYEKKHQQRTGFSLRIRSKGETRHVSDFATFQYLLERDGTHGKSNKYSVRSEATDRMCSICRQRKPLIHGFGAPFKYATVDKPGMVSGFFNQAANWKNYPICSDCAFDFEMGRDYVTQQLRQSFYGKSYYLIPQLVYDADEKLLKDWLRSFANIKYQPTEDGRASMDREDYLMEELADEFGVGGNQLTLNLLFFEENPTTKAIKIKLLLEELLPSRFQELFVTVPERVNGHPLYAGAVPLKNKQRGDLRFTFGLFRDFFDDDFYAITQTVFLKKPLALGYLFTRFMDRIRTNFNKIQSGGDGYVEFTRLTVLKAHLVFRYLHALEIISPSTHSTMTEEPFDIADAAEEDAKKKPKFNRSGFDQFVRESRQLFPKGDRSREGIFAVGVLVRFLLNMQARSLGATPFVTRLHGFHLDARKLNVIHRDALAKIIQYSRNKFFPYLNLRELLAETYQVNRALIQAMPADELSFYFVAGLEMGNNFKNKTDKNSDDDE